MKYTDIVFDIDGTLVDNWKRRCCLTPCDGEDCPLWAKYV